MLQKHISVIKNNSEERTVMKQITVITGSPRKDGNTARALKEIADTLKAEGVEIPSSMRVFFKNGDRLEILLKR